MGETGLPSAFASDDDWAVAVASLAPGTTVRGVVCSHYPFGFFVTLDDFPRVAGLVQIVDYKPDGPRPVYDAEGTLHPSYPDVGSPITAQVVWLRDSNRQVLLTSSGH
jgi:hypothetical protein